MKKSNIILLALMVFTIGSIILFIINFNMGIKDAINTDIPTETKNGFEGIILEGAWNVSFKQNTAYAIDPQFPPGIDADKIGIKIDNNKTLLLTNPDRNNPVSINLEAPLLQFIDSSGNSDINISSVKGDYFYVNGLDNSTFAFKGCEFDLIIFELKNSIAVIDPASGSFQGDISEKSVIRYKGKPDTTQLTVSDDSLLEEFDF